MRGTNSGPNGSIFDFAVKQDFDWEPCDVWNAEHFSPLRLQHGETA
jgi:hypothetical protein